VPDYVLCLIDDLFFASKIRAVAAALGVEVVFVKNGASIIEKLTERPPSRLIFDLNSAPQNLAEFISEIKRAAPLSHMPIIGFYSHVDNFLRERAIEAGIEQVLPRSVFTKRLGELLLPRDGEDGRGDSQAINQG
jgi:CheY-like chemotaxis protein